MANGSLIFSNFLLLCGGCCLIYNTNKKLWYMKSLQARQNKCYDFTKSNDNACFLSINLEEIVKHRKYSQTFSTV
jgi:hypothetical protein